MIDLMERSGFFAAGRFWVVLVLIVAGAIVIWQTWLAGPQTEAERRQRAWEAAMRADTVGGRTPEETLEMFVAALRAGDAEQASNFFLLDENASREKWLKRLADLKEKNLLAQMAEDIEKNARSILGIDENDVKFELLNNDGTLAVIFDMQLNTFSGVWKIESF